VIFQLELLKEMKIYPVFHTALLELAPKKTPVIRKQELDPESQKELESRIEKIISYSYLDESMYLVR
jgi:hypothetical protein